MRKLAIFAFSAAAAVFLAQYVLPLKVLPYISAGLALCTSLILCFRYKSTSNQAAAAAFILAGLALGFIWNWGYAQRHYLPAEALNGQTRSVEFIVLDFPVQRDYGASVDVKIDAGSVWIKTRLYIFEDNIPEIAPGASGRAGVTLSLADTIRNEKTDIFTSKGYFLFARCNGEVTITNAGGLSPRYIAPYIAKAVSGKIGEIFPQSTVPFLKALLLGDRTELYDAPELVNALSKTGVYHIVAVSGMHVAFFVGLLSLLTGRRRYAALLIVPVLILFAAVAGFTPSVTRAVIMQIFILAAGALLRENDGITALAAALLLILFLNPFAAKHVGLQLSFGSSLGILLISDKVFNWLNTYMQKVPGHGRKMVRGVLHYIAAGVSTTLGASILTVPLIAFYYGYVSLIAPVTNLLILWAANLAFSIGVCACAVGFLWSPLAVVLSFGAAGAVWYIEAVVRLLSRLQFAAVYTTNPLAVAWLIYVYLLIAAFFVMRRRPRNLLLPGLLAILSLCAVLILTVYTANRTKMSVTALDVGQGQCVVVTAGKYTTVIDCGSDSGENAGLVAAEYIAGQGRNRVDLLVLTHFDADHISGVETLLWSTEISALAVPEAGDGNAEIAEDLIALAKARGTDVMYITEDVCVTLGDAQVNLYAPLEKGADNDNGLFVLCTAGNFDFLVTGDAGENVEKRFLLTKQLPDIEVMMAGHHGSKYSNSDALFQRLRPEIVMISVGYNTYGHPTPEAMERMAECGAVIYRTDQMGNITVKAD